MRKTFAEIVEKGRLRDGSKYSTQSGKPYGMFALRCPATGERLRVIAADAETFAEEEGAEAGEPWDHVSVSCQRRCPTWGEMCWIKELFFTDDECVMQLHPAKSDYINDHPFVLHLWRPSKTPIPMPQKVCV